MPLDTAASYDVPEFLAPRIDALGLRENVRELVDQGYTIIQDPVAHALTDRVREAIVRLAEETGPPRTGQSAALLLGRDPVFSEAVLVPRLLALVEFLVGRGAILSQLTSSIRGEGAAPLVLHADNSWFPAPFPNWEIMATACWVTDEFTREGGCTSIIPGTHVLKRHPSEEECRIQEGLVPIVAPKGSLCLWDGSVWHGNYPREIPGQRVVMHMTYTRVGFAPVEDYSHLDDAWVANQPEGIADLLGRKLFLGATTVESGGADPVKLRYTQRIARSDKP
ncbi:phytanoyl-CoA dioxygenase family protein [Phenylobacterium sp.]|uniref:phytanoyl-CoA dioxygenase family protein n=1 Tax=Phenylobacterium sp. TaxID=1871053 RepID=UPI00301C0BDF